MAARERWWVGIKKGADRGIVIESPSKPTGYQTVLGPFPTRAAAEKFAQPPTTIPRTPTITNPLSGLSDIGKVSHWLGDAVLHVTDGAMWRSLGWLALGALLVIAGIYLWFRTSATYSNLQSAVVGTAKAL